MSSLIFQAIDWQTKTVRDKTDPEITKTEIYVFGKTKDKEDGIVKVISESEGEIFSYKGKMTIEKDPLSTVVTVIVPNDESILEENK